MSYKAPAINSIVDVSIRLEGLISEAMGHRPEQVEIKWSNVPFQRSQVAHCHAGEGLDRVE